MQAPPLEKPFRGMDFGLLLRIVNREAEFPLDYQTRIQYF